MKSIAKKEFVYSSHHQPSANVFETDAAVGRPLQAMALDARVRRVTTAAV